MRALVLSMVLLLGCQKPNEKITISTGEQLAPNAIYNSTDERIVLESVTNSIGMKLVLIPKGTFMMGSPESEPSLRKNESQHEVTISKDYYLGVTEVTQGQYEKVMGTNPSLRWMYELRSLEYPVVEVSWYPVDGVYWEDAVEFCKRLSELPEEKKAGRVYRLPTEAEWEYACRAGSTTAYSFGESSESLGDYAWFDKNSNQMTHPVGEKKPNAWGLYDMHGNVWEWCSDWRGGYPKGAVSDPTGPKEGSLRVYRGGGWAFDYVQGRSADRKWYYPSLRYIGNGFRVALSFPSGQSPGEAKNGGAKSSGAGTEGDSAEQRP